MVGITFIVFITFMGDTGLCLSGGSCYEKYVQDLQVQIPTQRMFAWKILNSYSVGIVGKQWLGQLLSMLSLKWELLKQIYG